MRTRQRFKFWLYKGVCITLLCFVYATLSGQNLVPNPNFDILTECPGNVNLISFAPPWYRLNEDLTPNLYHACATNDFWNVPNYGFDGFLEAKVGQGYAGLIVYSEIDLPNVQEFIQAPLLSPLVAGQEYYLEFFIAPFGNFFGNGDVFVNTAGLSLHQGSYRDTILPFTRLDILASLEYDGPVINREEWVQVCGTYTALGGEDHISLGSFELPSEVTTNTPGINDNLPLVGYMFFDAITVAAFDPLPDTIWLCDQEEAILDASFLDADYLWTTGETTASIGVSQTDLYAVDVILGSCQLRDSVYLIRPDTDDILADQYRFCKGEVLQLSVDPIFNSYQWSSGEQTNSINIAQAGNYSLTLTNPCGVFNYDTEVNTINCDCNIYVPNAFSPNADGVNDKLQIFPGCDLPYTIKSLRVFDRWGGLIYEEEEENNISWDGQFRGHPMPHGVYIWVLEYQFERGEETIIRQQTGDLILIR